MKTGHYTPVQQRIKRLAGILGVRIAGDLGGLTAYTNHNGRVVMYPQAPPTKPPTPAQLKHRARFALALQNWRARPTTEQADWSRLCDRAGLCMWGQNLYVSLALRPRNDELTDAIIATGIFVPFPEVIPL